MTYTSKFPTWHRTSNSIPLPLNKTGIFIQSEQIYPMGNNLRYKTVYKETCFAFTLTRFKVTARHWPKSFWILVLSNMTLPLNLQTLYEVTAYPLLKVTIWVNYEPDWREGRKNMFRTRIFDIILLWPSLFPINIGSRSL